MQTGVGQIVLQKVNCADVMEGKCNVKLSIVLESFFIYIIVTLHLTFLFYELYYDFTTHQKAAVETKDRM